MRNIEWMGSSLKDMIDMPDNVRGEFGHGLYLAQTGQRHVGAKPYGDNVELIERYDGDTYRCVYNIKIGDDILRSSCFPEEIDEGDSLPMHDRQTIEARLKAARRLAAEKLKMQSGSKKGE